jgi:hypothetical protein
MEVKTLRGALNLIWYRAGRPTCAKRLRRAGLPTLKLRRAGKASGISWFSAFLFQTSPRQKYYLVELPLEKPSPNWGTNCADTVGTISSPYSARLSLCGGENWLDQKPTENRKNLADYTVIRSLYFFTLEVGYPGGGA